MKPTPFSKRARSAFRKHRAVHGHYSHYTGILSLHGFARLAARTGDPALLEEIRQQLMPYVNGERDFPCNFPNYRCGGNATAWLLYSGQLPEAEVTVREHAERILHEAPRAANGILCHPAYPGGDVIWIDVAFAVSPFLLFSGLALNEPAWVDEALFQTMEMIRAFRVEETGLLNQSLNMRGPGHRSQDHWSRGNGWGAFALAELAVYLPENHPRKTEVVEMYLDHVRACAAFQNAEGLWHQEMTEPKESYVETSGSGLMLYALGIGLEAGLVDAAERPRFEQGLRGLSRYITPDTDIFHTCKGCLCPGGGTKLEYMAKPPVLNDCHAFGPVIFAMAQAHLLGIKPLTPETA
ncbi:MAG: glycoside hydrolase family 88 protein [Verrucomicrobia bacterium]|nr:glycoside hydrolase family 88 protein [Verrucomicrobiota bacterium]MCH8525860.1 glycoside hydrolase family 88 protein [Kiritimatiellia bacterium]